MVSVGPTSERVPRGSHGSAPTGGPRLARLVRGVVVELPGEVVGDVTLRVRRGIDVGSFESWIGYVFSPAVWGRGIATETVGELIEVARELRLPARGEVQEANLASERVLVKAGMSLIGTRHARRASGLWHRHGGDFGSRRDRFVAGSLIVRRSGGGAAAR
jgi:RimJ/RimL family protein N-acetyltransferase